MWAGAAGAELDFPGVSQTVRDQGCFSFLICLFVYLDSLLKAKKDLRVHNFLYFFVAAHTPSSNDCKKGTFVGVPL